MQCVILCRLEAKYPGRILKHVKLFAGVSAGSIVSTSLASGFSPQFTLSMFKLVGPYIFQQNKVRTVYGYSVGKAKYSRKNLMIIGSELLHNKKLCDFDRGLLITAFALDNNKPEPKRTWEPRVYENMSQKPTEHTDTPVWDLVLASAAAPTYFSSYHQQIDGGVISNDPGMTACIISMSKRNVRREDLVVLSVGTGRWRQWLEGEELDWGILQWGPKLGDVLFAASDLQNEEMARVLAEERYHKVNVELEYAVALDDARFMDMMIELAKNVDLKETEEWIEKYWL
eukprot:TRINITY_DN5007_c1_g1_i1.p1 TRINITY_DN5007_c1_g1~~TRINITY_DN5007_c1_g1_i1.p1  ORF type:complete len:286 (-),score=66.27 TRINITY_DN5007_c1_g1_i1:7-864(-)